MKLTCNVFYTAKSPEILERILKDINEMFGLEVAEATVTGLDPIDPDDPEFPKGYCQAALVLKIKLACLADVLNRLRSIPGYQAY